MKKKVFLLVFLVSLFLINPFIVGAEKIQDPTNPLRYYDELFFVDIDAGTYHNIVLAEDGRVFTFGYNGYGQLGNNSTTSASSLIEITGNLSLAEDEVVVEVEAGGNHTGVLTSNHQLYLWGYNLYGQLGDSTNVNKPLPLNVTSFFSLGVDEFITSFALGDNNTIVLTNLGRVFTIGRNYNYQLGDMSTTDKNYPVDITANFTLEVDEQVVKVEFDYEYAAAITNLGKIFLWGRNSDGQLGIGSKVYQNAPTNATNFFNLNVDEMIVDVELGYDHTLVITNQNRVFAFGENMYYQVGDGTSVDRLLPVYINNNLFSASLNKQYISVAAGYKDTMVITSEGDVLTYGYGDYGQRGNGTNTTAIAKSNITINLNLDEDEIVVLGKMGYHHTLVLTSNGRVISFGRNQQGQLGIGSITAYNAWPNFIISEADVVEIIDNYLPIAENIIDVASGYLSSVLVTETGKVFTWGTNDFGSLGNNNLVSAHMNPTEITGNFSLAANDKIIKVFASENGSSYAAISELGKVFVWGYNAYGNLGDFTTTDLTLPKDITSNFSISVGDYITDIVFGPTHTIALSNNGYVFTWGTNDMGQLGNASLTNYYYPQNITSRFSLGAGEEVVKVSAGLKFSAALTNQGRLFMWGSREVGQLADAPGTTKVISPSDRTSLLGLSVGETVVDFDSGYTHTLVLTSINNVIGFGSNNYGQIGNLETASSSLPYNMTTNLNLYGDNVVSLNAGTGSTVIITDNNRIIAFGNSNFNLTIPTTPIPTDITSNYSLNPLEEISIYALSTLNAFMVTSENRLLASGLNDYYMIGNGLNTPQTYATPVQISPDVIDKGNVLLIESPEIMYNYLLPVPIVIYPEFNVGPSLVSLTINGVVYSDFDVLDGRILVDVNHETAYGDTLNITIESFNFLNASVSVAGNNLASTLFMLDDVPPTFDYIEDQTIELGEFSDIDWSAYIVNESDNIEGVLTKQEVLDEVNYSSVGIYSVTVKLVDEALNETSQTFNVNVVDTTAPTFDFIEDQTIEADIDFIPLWTSLIQNESDNSSDILQKGVFEDNVIPYLVGSYTVTVELIDQSNNVAYQTFTVNVVDTTAPVMGFVEDQVLELGGIYDGLFWESIIPSIFDNSFEEVAITVDDSLVNYNQLGAYPLTIIATDSYGNVSTQDTLITFVDTTAPTFDFIADQTIEADYNFVANWTALIQNATDNSFDPLPRSVVEDNVIPFMVGSYTVTVKVMDQSGNETLQTFTVHVVDTTPPVMGLVDDQVLELGQIYDPEYWRNQVPSLFDNSLEEVTISIDDSFVDYNFIGEYELTIIATDNYNNQTSQVILVTIVDTTPPGFDYILTQTIEAGEFIDIDWTTYMINLTDNSLTTLTKIEVEDNVIYNQVGDYQVTVRLIDESLNETSQTFTVSVVDTTNPTFDDIGNQVIEVGEFSDIDWTYLAQNLSDNGIDELIVSEADRVNYTKVGSYTVTIIVMDNRSNMTSKDFTVDVVDTTAPTADEVEPQVLEAGDFLEYPSLVVNLYDNSNEYVDIYIISDLVDYYTPGTYQVTLRLMDLYGNFSLLYIDVTVIDTLAPYIGYIEDLVFEAGTYTGINWITLMTNVYDNTLKEVDKYVISSNVSFNEVGTYQVVLGARDASMNESTITVTVRIIDTVAPEVYLMHAVDTIFVGDNYNDKGVLTVDVTAVDILIEGTVDTNTVGTYTLTYTVTDSGGNTTSIKRIVTVLAKEAEIELVLNAGLTTIKEGDEYIDSGCMVYLNGNLYNEATIIETDLDRNQAGIYYILYGFTYQDKEYTFKRIVFVVDELINEPLVLVMWKEDEE
ncbi:MAG: hypothetical protein CVV60_03405 [Tenericutes bacterium HGW-Tenericutes-5]|nr:MAG: hypothetical protein CVV60_03405 [Tenericutes bacterium HGW-Tenericutes-5]